MSRKQHTQSHPSKTSLPKRTRAAKNGEGAAGHQLLHRTVQRAFTDPNLLTSGDLITLQRTLGNSAVQRILADRTPQARATSPTPVSSTYPPLIQRQYRTGTTDDAYEREANQVARQVIGRLRSRNATQPAYTVPSRKVRAPTEQAAKPEKTIQAGPKLHRQASGSFGTASRDKSVSPQVIARIQASRSGGRPLAAPVRSLMEQAFGADFSALRIHDSTRADVLSRSIHARAFATGNDVFFRKGEFRPDTQTGRALLAHELTHVVQQSLQPQNASPQARLPNSRQSAAAGSALGQPLEIVHGSQPGRIHRTDDDDAKKASTGPTGNTGRTTDRPTTPLSEEQNYAIELIDSTDLAKTYKTRAIKIIQNPDIISQTAFGICGMVSILRAVVKSNPVRFAQITMTALADTEISSTWLPVFKAKALPVHKSAGAQLEFLVSQWLIRKAPSGEVSQKVLSRDSETGEMVETTKSKDYSKVFDKQKDFSEKFKIDDWENKGSFATTTGGLNYMLGALGTGRESFKINVTDFDKDYKLAKDKAGLKGSVIASVTDVDFYQKDGAAIDTPMEKKDVEKKDGPKFRHWVMLDDVKEVGQYYVLDIWTWGKHFPAKVNKTVIQTYIPSLLVT